MYIKRIESWWEKNWSAYFDYTWMNYTKQERKEIVGILTQDKKEDVERGFPRLRELGIINWIWPSFFIRSIRNLLSWFFRWVKEEWHDIMYWIGWTEAERLDTDFWLFKYSYLSTRGFVVEGRIRLNPILSLLLYPIAFIQILFALLCTIIVVVFGRFNFRYITEIDDI